MKWIVLSFLASSIPATAQTKAVMEGPWASNYTLKLDTTNVRVGIGYSKLQRTLTVNSGTDNYVSSFSAVGQTLQTYADSSGVFQFAGDSTLAAGGPFIGFDNVGTTLNKNLYLGFSGNANFTMNGFGAITQMPRISSQTLVLDGNASNSMATSGSIGVGVIAPLSKLQVYDSVLGNHILTQDGTRSVALYTDTVYSLVYTTTNHNMFVGANNGAAMVMLSTNGGMSIGTYGPATTTPPSNGVIISGSVGVGTTSPATKIHMSSGTLTVDGTAAAIAVVGGSVTASAFFGDGSHLTGVTTVSNSSYTANFSATSNGPTALGVCQTTVTLTTGSTGKLRVVYAGPVENTTGSRYTAVSFLIDGAFPTGLSAQVPVYYVLGTEEPNNGSFVWTTQSFSAGSHSACFTMATNAGVGNACGSVSALGGFTPACQFGVEEVK